MPDTHDPTPPKRSTPVNIEGDAAYKRHRIHVKHLPSGRHVVSVVHYTPAGTEVENLRGEYSTRVDAVTAAREHIDHHTHEQ